MSKEIKISSTRINTFLQCKQKYWFNYVDHLPKLANPVFRLGISVHSALEFAGKIWMKKGKFSASDKKSILKEYDRVSVEEGIEEMTIHKEGRDLVNKRIKDFDLGGRILGLEALFGMRGAQDVVTKEGVPLIGAIDKVVELDEDTLLIVDYKTSKTAPTSDQLKTDKQLSIYDLVASILWPQYKRIIVSLDLLRHDIIYSYRTDEDREEFSGYLKAVYDQMTSLKAEDVSATINTFCGWCDYKDYCSVYKKACGRKDYKFVDPSAFDSSKLMEEWQHVSNMKKTLEQRYRELSMLMIDRIKINGENINDGEKEVYIRQSNKRTYDTAVAASVIDPSHFAKLVKVNKRSLEDYMERNPVVKEKIVASMTSNFTTPFLATKKVRK